MSTEHRSPAATDRSTYREVPNSWAVAWATPGSDAAVVTISSGAPMRVAGVLMRIDEDAQTMTSTELVDLGDEYDGPAVDGTLGIVIPPIPHMVAWQPLALYHCELLCKDPRAFAVADDQLAKTQRAVAVLQSIGGKTTLNEEIYLQRLLKERHKRVSAMSAMNAAAMSSA